MRRRIRLLLLAVVGAVVLAVAGGYVVLRLTGDDAPPPPALSRAPAAGDAAARGVHRWRPIAGQGTFVGYRVNEQLPLRRPDMRGITVGKLLEGLRKALPAQ